MDFADARSYAFFEWPEFLGLSLVGHNGRTLLFGIPSHFDVSAVEKFLSERGLLEMSAEESSRIAREWIPLEIGDGRS